MGEHGGNVPTPPDVLLEASVNQDSEMEMKGEDTGSRESNAELPVQMPSETYPMSIRPSRFSRAEHFQPSDPADVVGGSLPNTYNFEHPHLTRSSLRLDSARASRRSVSPSPQLGISPTATRSHALPGTSPHGSGRGADHPLCILTVWYYVDYQKILWSPLMISRFFMQNLRPESRYRRR